MVQVRKPEIQDAILSGAKELFQARGYNQTTVGQIAAQASVTTSNIYNYFPSKLDIFFAIYAPWYAERLDKLDADVDAIQDPKQKLKKVIRTILMDLPVEDRCFSNNLIQAVSTRPDDRTFSGSNLEASEKKVSAILRKILPESRQWLIEDDVFSHFLLMAFDGFAMNARVTGPERRMEEIIDMLCEFILGPADGARNRGTQTTVKGAASMPARKKRESVGEQVS